MRVDICCLVAERQLDPQLAGELSWEEMSEALKRLGNRDVAGKVALTLRRWSSSNPCGA